MLLCNIAMTIKPPNRFNKAFYTKNVCCMFRYKALTGQGSHDHNHSGAGHDHQRAVWYGLTTLAGIYLFFVVERVVGLCSERKRSQNEHRVKVCFLCLAIDFDDVRLLF